MKKLYPTLIISLLFLLIGCSTELDTLQKRDDTYYEIISEEPFSGLIINKYESGQKHTKGYLTNGREDGYWTWWYEGSPKNHIRLYLDNILDNLPYLFYDSWENYGQKRKVVDYLDGTKDGLSTEWYENGQKKEEGTYKDGKEDGLWTGWYDNGQKEIEGTFKDGKPDGLSTLWYENGQKRQEGTENEWTYWNEDYFLLGWFFGMELAMERSTRLKSQRKIT
jgi:antitoxin component YwqK of YwqJK toxin-antitoxin module